MTLVREGEINVTVYCLGPYRSQGTPVLRRSTPGDVLQKTFLSFQSLYRLTSSPVARRPVSYAPLYVYKFSVEPLLGRLN